MKKLLIVVAIVCLFCSPAFAQQATATRGTNVRPSASADQQPVAHLSAGDTVTLLSTTKKNGYFHVETADGKKGWAWAKNLTDQQSGTGATTPAFAAPLAAAAGAGSEATNVASCPPAGKDKQGSKISPATNAGLLNLAKRHIPAGSTPKTLELADFVKLITATEAEFGIDARQNSSSSSPTRTKLKPLPGNSRARRRPRAVFRLRQRGAPAARRISQLLQHDVIPTSTQHRGEGQDRNSTASSSR